MSVLAVWCATVQAHVVTTNEAAWREIEGWRGKIAAGRAGEVVAQLDEVMRGPVQWRAPVLCGDGWVYPWGYFALSTYAQACRRLGQPVRAYRALANAFTYLPTAAPPAQAAGEYWRWHIAMGQQCAALNRLFDAHWYLQQARSGLATNEGLYYKATAELAGVVSRLGEHERAAALLGEVFARRRWQPTPVWYNYIRLLFLCGRFEEGVAAILAGARARGQRGRCPSMFR